MESTTDTPAPPNRMRFEIIFGSVWLAIGLFLLPAVIFWVGVTLLGPYGEGQGAGMGTFYGDFYGNLAQGQPRAWALALGPLVVISLIRACFIGTRPQPEVVPEPQTAPPVPKAQKTQDARRVEPRVD